MLNCTVQMIERL